MRSRYKTLLVCMVAMFAVSAVAAAGASASPQYKIAGSPFTGTETIAGKLSSSTLSVEIIYNAELNNNLSCTGVSTTGGTISENFKGKAEKFVYTGCKENRSNCHLLKSNGEPTETIETYALKSEVIEEGGKLYVKYTPISGTNFMRFYTEGVGCLNETTTVEGTARCHLASTVEEVSKGCEFNSTSGSALTWELLGEPIKRVARVIGTVGFKLTGTHTGSIWGVS